MEAARKPVGPIDILPVLPPNTLSDLPVYTPAELELSSKLKGSKGLTGWIHLPDGCTLVPGALGRKPVSLVHQSTYLGGTKLIELLKRDYYIPGLYKMAKEVTTGCHMYAQVNPGPPVEVQIGSRLRGQSPGKHWELDFTEVSPGTFGFKYLLVFIDTYSGWTEAFPTKRETAQVVAKKLVSEIVPRFGLPLTLGFNNGPAFIATASQTLARMLGIDWKPHCIYRLQSSGQVERMNRTLKETLTKFQLETGENWVSLLPSPLLRAQCPPYCREITPCKFMLKRRPPLLPKLGRVGSQRSVTSPFLGPCRLST